MLATYRAEMKSDHKTKQKNILHSVTNFMNKFVSFFILKKYLPAKNFFFFLVTLFIIT